MSVDEMRLSKKVVRDGDKALRGSSPSGVKAFGKYWAFSAAEHEELSGIERLSQSYVRAIEHRAPLCFAVFGPPGSGKTFAVKQLRSRVESAAQVKLPVHEINVSQMNDEEQLSDALAGVAGDSLPESVPMVFFDEFDTQLHGTPLGWLRWFLMPMDEGRWRHGPIAYSLKGAIFVFAGGTADRFADFTGRNAPGAKKAFCEAKGPDFVSRLRGYVDVRGVNDPVHRPLRRAVILHDALKKRHVAVKAGAAGKILPIDEDLVDSFLRVGRYRHGARSMRAILEMSSVKGTKGTRRLTRSGLPEDHLIAFHVDRGFLDPRRTGGLIQMSGGAETEEAQGRYEEFWNALAKELWRCGATIGYGGLTGKQLRRLKGSGWKTLTDLIKDESKNHPKPLLRGKPKCASPHDTTDLIRLRIFAPRGPHDLRGTARREDCSTCLEGVSGLDGKERKNLNRLAGGQLENDAGVLGAANVLCLFRMRLQVAESSAAIVALGGKERGWSGRFPGVVEEIVLALALKRPVYLCGAPGGMVGQLGTVLGLDRPWRGVPPSLLEPKGQEWSELRDRLKRLEYAFRPPGLPPELPITLAELADFLAGRAIGSKDWPNNGLSADENRSLFHEADPYRATETVIEGLRRCMSHGL